MKGTKLLYILFSAAFLSFTPVNKKILSLMPGMAEMIWGKFNGHLKKISSEYRKGNQKVQ
jgi:hypothetical protein